MKKVIALIPTALNDGTPVLQKFFRRFENELLDIADGFSQDAMVKGEWRDRDGTVYCDRNLRYIIVTDQIDELKALIQRVGRELKQKTMYFEVQECEIEYIETR